MNSEEKSCNVHVEDPRVRTPGSKFLIFFIPDFCFKFYCQLKLSFFSTIIIITGPIHRENIYKKSFSRCIILYISFLSIRNIYINLTTGSSANFRYMSVQFGGTESNEPHSQNLPLCVNTFLCDLLFRGWRNVY